MTKANKKFNILVVEDDPVDAELLGQAFSRYGDVVQMDHIDCGEDALSRIRSFADDNPGERPHLIVLDVCLPDVDGAKLYALCSFSIGARGIPMVIFTGGGHVGLETCSNTDPRMIYLRKPDSTGGYATAADAMLDHAAAYIAKSEMKLAS